MKKKRHSVNDPDAVKRILRDPNWTVDDAVTNVDKVSDRMQQPLINSKQIVRDLPLSHEGEMHTQLRNAVKADLILPDQDLLTARYSKVLGSLARATENDHPIAQNLLRIPVDQLADLSLIEGSAVLSRLTEEQKIGLGQTLADHGGLDRFLDPAAPAAVRRRNEKILGAVHKLLQGLGLTNEERTTALRVIVMGRDPLRASIAAFLVQYAADTNGPPRQIHGVQWVMRRSPSPQTDEASTASSEHTRLELTGSRELLFGVGRHTCTGKSLALRTAKAWQAAIDQAGVKPVISQFVPAPQSAVFAGPQILEGWFQHVSKI